jgi:F0F1-type ATP synthase delta subunit
MPCLSLPVLCLVSLQPLDKLQRTELTKEAQQYVQAGFKLVMQEKVDRSLMGGFVLEFEDRLVDMSVKKKLEEFNNLVRAGSAAGLVTGRAGGSGAAGW